MFKLLKTTTKDLFLTRQLCRGHYRGVTQGEYSEIQNVVFSKRKTLRDWELVEGFISIGRLQLDVDKNSEDLANLILGFDDVTVKTIYPETKQSLNVQ